MRNIELKVTKMNMGEPEPQLIDLDYKAQIMALLLIPLDPQAGAKYEEMATVFPIHAKINAAEGYVLLEEAEHAEVVLRLKNAQFRQNTPEIFEMIESVINAPEHIVKADIG